MSSGHRQFISLDYTASRVAGSYLNGNPGTFCSLYWELDYNTNQCALAVTQQHVRPHVEMPRNFDHHSWRPETILGICASWNRGTCAFPRSCTFRHVCAVCQRGHIGIECPDAQEGSEYHQWQLSMKKTSVPVAVATALVIDRHSWKGTCSCSDLGSTLGKVVGRPPCTLPL